MYLKVLAEIKVGKSDVPRLTFFMYVLDMMQKLLVCSGPAFGNMVVPTGCLEREKDHQICIVATDRIYSEYDSTHMRLGVCC
jgi:hypothetical protein